MRAARRPRCRGPATDARDSREPGTSNPAQPPGVTDLRSGRSDESRWHRQRREASHQIPRPRAHVRRDRVGRRGGRRVHIVIRLGRAEHGLFRPRPAPAPALPQERWTTAPTRRARTRSGATALVASTCAGLGDGSVPPSAGRTPITATHANVSAATISTTQRVVMTIPAPVVDCVLRRPADRCPCQQSSIHAHQGAVKKRASGIQIL
jgi:hypothetical protein